MHPRSWLRWDSRDTGSLNVHGTDEDGTHARTHTRVQAPATQPPGKAVALEMTTPSKANQTREREIPHGLTQQTQAWHTAPADPSVEQNQTQMQGTRARLPGEDREGSGSLGFAEANSYAPRGRTTRASAQRRGPTQYPAITCNRKEYEKGYILMDNRSILL